MGKWIYRKPEPTNVRGLCVKCGKNPQKRIASTDKYRPLCSNCDRKLRRSPEGKQLDREKTKRYNKYKRRPYRMFVKGFCERCGFIPEHICQLDVDHIDGNNHNNDPTNLQTLCSNCHRLKTYLNKDWEP